MSVNYEQMRELLEKLVKDMSGSSGTRSINDRLNEVIRELEKNKNQNTPNSDRELRGFIRDLSQAMNRNKSSGTSAGDRREGSYLDELGKSLRETSGDFYKNHTQAQIFQNRLSGLSETMRGFSGIVSSLFELTGISKAIKGTSEALDSRADSYRTMMNNGMTFGGDILQMSRTANQANMTLDTFTKAIQGGSQGLKLFGPQMFADTIKTIQKTNLEFSDLGLNTDQLNSHLSDYVEMQRKSGGLFNKSSTEVATSFRRLQQDSLDLASAVGSSREAILADMKQASKDPDIGSVIALQGGQRGENIRAMYAMLKQSMGDGPEAEHIAKQFALRAGGVATTESYSIDQQTGGALGNVATQFQQLNQSGMRLDPEILAKLGKEFITESQTATRSQMAAAPSAFIGSTDSYGQSVTNTFATINGANIDPQRAVNAEEGQQKQSTLTNSALNKATSKEAIAAAKEAAATESLSAIQETLGQSLKAWNSAMVEGLPKIQKAMEAIANNPVTRGLDSMGGSLIHGLSSLVGPTGLLVGIMGIAGSIKMLGGAKAAIEVLQTFHRSKNQMRAGIRQYRSGRYLSDVYDRMQREDLLRERRRPGRRSRIEPLRRRRPSLNPLGGQRSGFNLPKIGKGKMSIPKIPKIGGGALAGGLMMLDSAVENSQSTSDLKAGRISKSQDNINHDSNYGQMIGTVLGGALGALVGPEGIPIGAFLGGSVGGLAGGAFGKWMNPEDQPETPQSQPSQDSNTQTPSDTSSDTNQLLRNIISQNQTLIDVIQERDSSILTTLQTISRNTSETVQKLKNVGNHI